MTPSSAFGTFSPVPGGERCLNALLPARGEKVPEGRMRGLSLEALFAAQDDSWRYSRSPSRHSAGFAPVTRSYRSVDRTE
jgi:hypothetical protein